MTDSDLVIIDFCSRYLHRIVPEPVADREQLAGLAEDVEKLFSEIAASETLEAELRTFLLAQLETIRKGIQEYRIGGLERLREALGQVIGRTIVNQDIVEKENDSDEVKQFIEVTSKLMSIIRFAWKTTKAIDSVKGFLPLLLMGRAG